MQRRAPNSADSFLALARRWAATVTVVTTRRAPEHAPVDAPVDADDGAAFDGFTATAFLTVSMVPPMIAVSATRTSSAFTMLRDSAAFAVNMLSHDQSELASAFARPPEERIGLWERVAWSPDPAGVPLFDGCVGSFSAQVRHLIDAGDHVLVLADVTAIHLGDDEETLVYHNRGYGRVMRHGA